MVTDLIGLGVNNSKGHHYDEQQEKAEREEGKRLHSLTVTTATAIPSSDRPMSFVQELDESAQQSEDEQEEATAPETISKTTITTTTVLKSSPKTTSNSSKSISEDEIRKDFPNLPRKT